MCESNLYLKTCRSVFGHMPPALSFQPWMTEYHHCQNTGAATFVKNQLPAIKLFCFTGTKLQQTWRNGWTPKARHCKRVTRRTYFICCGEHVWKRYRNLSRGGAFCDGCQHCEKNRHTHRLNYSRLCTAVWMWRKLKQSTKNLKSFSVCAHHENARWVRNITIDFNIFCTLVPSTTTFTKWLQLMLALIKSSHSVKNCGHWQPGTFRG